MKTMKTAMIEAAYSWFVDRQRKAYIIIDVPAFKALGGSLSTQSIDDLVLEPNKNKVILNLTPAAVSALVFEGSVLQFRCRFNGTDCLCVIPTEAIIAMYNKDEPKEVVSFEFSLDVDYYNPIPVPIMVNDKTTKPKFTVVK